MNIPLFQCLLSVLVHSLTFFARKGVIPGARGHDNCYEFYGAVFSTVRENAADLSLAEYEKIYGSWVCILGNSNTTGNLVVNVMSSEMCF